MATRRNGLPEVWPSGLAKWLAGDLSCGFALWFKAHYRKFAKQPSDFDWAEWQVAHTALLNATVQRLTDDGWKCRVENQNYFKLQGTSGILCGKPDIVAKRDGVTKVVDAKTGQPNASHSVQVAIYMVALPLCWNHALYVTGEVVYRDHTVEVGPEEAEAFKPRIFAAMRELGADDALAAVPSARECGWCDITSADCPDRVDADATETVKTEAF